MSYAIVFSSKTGNTRLLADTLRASLPQNECTYFGAPAPEALEAETLYIGFWTDKGHADDTLTAFLQTLKGKRVFFVRYRRLWRQCGIFRADPGSGAEIAG